MTYYETIYLSYINTAHPFNVSKRHGVRTLKLTKNQSNVYIHLILVSLAKPLYIVLELLCFIYVLCFYSKNL